ncbi:MAG: DNA mismatch repair protein MutT [Chloroflexi bacterium]|nr:DNA mismatch repair protein MutT [Chloroflexota bacterium]|tara:strand:+ start:84 stop:560 length:477 start_codon:yes stop_codon:yes gene_type:complete
MKTIYNSAGEIIKKCPDSIRPSVCAIIINKNNEILLEQRSDNYLWGLPGGGVEIGESITQALHREVMEETGLKVEIIELIGIYSDPKNYSIMSYPDGGLVQYVSITFKCKPISRSIKISDESINLKFFDIEKLPEKLMVGHKSRINDSITNINLPIIK